MSTRIGVVGYPGPVGGACTELWHQIKVWRAMGLDVTLVPQSEQSGMFRGLMDKLGCVTAKPNDFSVLADSIVVGYCSKAFLDNIEVLRKTARKLVWANCMCWLFDGESAISQHFLDLCLYQSWYQRDQIAGKHKCPGIVYTPYFDVSSLPFTPQEQRFDHRFRLVHISRDDPGKFVSNYWWIWDTFVAPVPKQGRVLGWNDAIERKVGAPPDWVQCHPAGQQPVDVPLKQGHVLCHAQDIAENLPRAGMEAMASGLPVLADQRGGWRELISHGKTGLLAETPREHVYWLSRLAYESKLRAELAHAARAEVETRWGMKASTESWAQVLEFLK